MYEEEANSIISWTLLCHFGRMDERERLELDLSFVGCPEVNHMEGKGWRR